MSEDKHSSFYQRFSSHCTTAVIWLLAVLLPAVVQAGSVILFVGDGMGLAQREAARLTACGPDGRLAMDQLEYLSLVTTHSADALTTDSAAGATAWSTGHKTDNRFLAITPDGAVLPTVLERARDAGLGTGLVTTTAITDATPAAFAAHVEDRSSQALIAEQMLVCRPQVMMGGGSAFWTPKSSSGSKRTDERDLMAEARAAGYSVVQTATELVHLDIERTRYLLGLFDESHMAYEYDRQGEVEPELAATPWTALSVLQRLIGLFTESHMTYAYDRQGKTEPELSVMTQVALGVLKNSKRGFFLMVEGGRIDHACHNNDATRAIWETIAFDKAVAEGIDYARRDRHTLVIVVADHETGGMSVGTSCYHPFAQIPSNNDFPDRSVQLDSALCISWTTKGHTSIPVIAGAMGPGAEQFHGMMDNTEIFYIMEKALGLNLAQTSAALK